MKSMFKLIILIAILVIVGVIVFSGHKESLTNPQDQNSEESNNENNEDVVISNGLVRGVLARASENNDSQVWQPTDMSEPTLVSDILENEHAWMDAYGLMQMELGLPTEEMDMLWSELTSQLMVGEWETVVEQYQNETTRPADGEEIPEGVIVIEIPTVSYETGDIGPFGCDAYINYMVVQVPETSGVLNEVFVKMFNEIPELPEEGDLSDQNIVASQTSLMYDAVELIDGEARLYLSGEVMANHCADPAFQGQVEAAAFQFETVDSLTVYVNNEIFDWCELDQSDGEGPCPENPKLWQVNRGEEIYN